MGAKRPSGHVLSRPYKELYGTAGIRVLVTEKGRKRGSALERLQRETRL
jgi:hypothetical protein